MYLVGDFSFRDNFDNGGIVLKKNVDRADLGKAKEDENYQVIDLFTKKFFSPELNRWVGIQSG